MRVGGRIERETRGREWRERVKDEGKEIEGRGEEKKVRGEERRKGEGKETRKGIRGGK